MRHSEFWSRLHEALGEVSARHWAETHAITELGSRTAVEALDAGESPRRVWLAVWRTLELPPSSR
ncbi:DUF3046 domain-containing protein [Nocardioides sp.]|uniref:DUF3046 domain-containing protein n=1 Tax=Nocardioides sp. TaxID=35761 RepID=UPI0027327AB7|nr:DUF3046 domain-containing protein [Nocardioides sp.]MDP3894118.1 DUF3046 domain-containing protein [Nocardioides sp.]